MATSNGRDVKMTLSVETLGAEEIQKLGASVEKLAKEGGDAAPEFQKLADEIARLGDQAAALRAFQQLSDQTAELSVTQEKAAADTTVLKDRLDALSLATRQAKDSQAGAAAALAEVAAASRDTKTAIELLALNTTKAGKADQLYKAEKDGLAATLIFQKVQIEQLTAELRKSDAAVNAAAAAEDKLADAYKRSAREANAASEAVKSSRSDLELSVAAATKLGVATDNVAGAQARLVQGLNQAGSAARQSSEKLTAAAVGAKALKDALELTALEAKKAADSATSASQTINTAFRTVGVRSAQDLQAEIAQVRAAMDTVKTSGQATGAALSTAFAAGEARIQALERDIRRVTGSLTSADRAASLFKNSMGQITAGNIIADGVGYMVNKVKELGVAFVGTIVQTESLRKGLVAVYKDVALANSQFDFLKKTASDAGVNVAGLSQSFLKFAAANKSSNVPLAETNALFLAVARAGGVLGLSGEQVNGTLDALGQIASKGTVSMEELRQQLGDRLPGALGLTAKGLGITEAELIKLVETGGLAYRDFVVPFTQGLGELQGATDGLLPSYQRFKNALTETAQSAGDAGFTEVLAAGIRSLALAAGTVVVPLLSFVETVFLVAKGSAALVSRLQGNKEALNEFSAEVEASGGRISKLSETFKVAVEGQSALASAQTAATTAMQASGLAAAKTALAVEGVSVSQQAQAFSAKLAADSTLGYGAKLVQLNTFVGQALDQQNKQIEADEKLAKGAKIQGQNLITLAELKGQDGALIEAQVAASNLNVEALAKVNAAQAEQTRLLQLQLDALVATSVAQDGNTEKRKTEIEAIAKKLVVSAAETEQSKQAEAAARAELATRALAAKVYEDNAASVGKFAIELRLANDTVAEYQRLQANGKKTEEEVTAARLRAAQAQGLFNDAVNDSAKALDRQTRARDANLSVEQAKISVQQASIRNEIEYARSIGDTARVTELQVAAKQLEIKAITLGLNVKRLDLSADLAKIEVDRQKLTSTGALRVAEEAELAIKIKAIEAKRIELGLGLEQIRALENEVTALRNSNGARADGQGGIQRDTQLRDQNTGSINRQTDALIKQDATKAQYTNPKGGSVTGSSREERLAGQAATDGTGAAALEEKRRNGTLSADDLGTARALKSAADFNRRQFEENGKSFSLEGGRSINEESNRANTILQQVEELAAQAKGGASATPPTTAASTSADATGVRNRTVTINLGGRTTVVGVDSQQSGDALVGLLRGLESGKGTSQ